MRTPTIKFNFLNGFSTHSSTPANLVDIVYKLLKIQFATSKAVYLAAGAVIAHSNHSLLFAASLPIKIEFNYLLRNTAGVYQ